MTSSTEEFLHQLADNPAVASGVCEAWQSGVDRRSRLFANCDYTSCKRAKADDVIPYCIASLHCANGHDEAECSENSTSNSATLIL